MDEWEAQVATKEGYTTSEKSKMLLSRETIDGLRITGILCNKVHYYIVDMLGSAKVFFIRGVLYREINLYTVVHVCTFSVHYREVLCYRESPLMETPLYCIVGNFRWVLISFKNESKNEIA